MELIKLRNSGLLEAYVLGELSLQEKEIVTNSLLKYPELKKDLFEIEKALEFYAFSNKIDASDSVKPMLFSIINYVERIENGEQIRPVPDLSFDSKISDFSFWLDQEHLQEAEEYESMFGHIIGETKEKTTLIVWLKHGAPPEIHTDEIEKFLIIEGTCDITIGNDTHSLKKGDYLEIPLHISHTVKVSSSIRCKLILERSAA